jgi:hypothetical protein
MTDTPAAPEQQPPMWHEGQAWSREMAAAELAKFDADADKVKAALGGDVAKQQERRDLWMMARGHQPGAVPTVPSDAAGIAQQMDEREQQLRDAVLDTWTKRVTMNPERQFQMRRGLATKEQMAEARNRIERAKRDPEFGRKVLSGDMDASEQWAAWHFVAHHCREAPADFDWSKDAP